MKCILQLLNQGGPRQNHYCFVLLLMVIKPQKKIQNKHERFAEYILAIIKAKNWS